jgi:tetratricopeptide (TPR) repeat protein
MNSLDLDEDRPAAPDVFISYASADVERAAALHARLKAAGLVVWFDKAHLRDGCRWYDEIAAGCDAARVMLPLLTPSWSLSNWTKFETYIHDDIIPIIAEGTKAVLPPPLCVPQAVWFDPLAPDEAVWKGLLASIRDRLAAPPPVKTDRIIQLIYQPNPFFCGRETELNKIHEALHTAPTAALTQGKVQALAAMGGVGKTTLANEYAHRHWRCYRQIFWVDARAGAGNSRLKLESEFARLCEILFPASKESGLSVPEKAQRALAELSDKTPRLLVIDNAEDAESVRPFLPRGAGCGCRTLITSRFADWPQAAGVDTITLYVLEPKPAREFLVHRSGQPAEGAEQTACDDLAKALGYLPLALEQAAAYIAQGGGMRFAKYLALYQEIYADLLAEKVTGSTLYPDPVLITWEATTQKLTAEARGILRLCAWYADTLLPKSLVYEGAEAVFEVAAVFGVVAPTKGGAADEHRLTKALAELKNYSMIMDATTDKFRIHGLVQTVERVQAEKAGQDEAVKDQALTRLAALFPYAYNAPQHWPLCALLLPHTEKLLAYAFPDVAMNRVATLLNNTGSYMQGQGTPAAALPLCQRALEARERILGKEHPDTLLSVNNLAGCLETLGDAPAALPLYQRAREARERVLGKEHPVTLASVNNLANCLRTLGNAKAALPLFQRALEAYERILGKEHPDTLTSVNNLAYCLETLGDAQAALPLFQRALEACERILGKEHPDTLISVNNLASCLQTLGDAQSALPLHQRAREARERVLGKEHPDTLRSVNNLALCLETLGDAQAALPLHQGALEGCERILGKEHPDTLRSVNNLASCMRTLGDAQAALPLFERAANTAARVLGEDHPWTKTFRENYEIALREAGQEKGQKWITTPRNAPCPCGSGKKYKHCHGQINGEPA